MSSSNDDSSSEFAFKILTRENTLRNSFRGIGNSDNLIQINNDLECENIKLQQQLLACKQSELDARSELTDLNSELQSLKIQHAKSTNSSFDTIFSSINFEDETPKNEHVIDQIKLDAQAQIATLQKELEIANKNLEQLQKTHLNFNRDYKLNSEKKKTDFWNIVQQINQLKSSFLDLCQKNKIDIEKHKLEISKISESFKSGFHSIQLSENLKEFHLQEQIRKLEKYLNQSHELFQHCQQKRDLERFEFQSKISSLVNTNNKLTIQNSNYENIIKYVCQKVINFDSLDDPVESFRSEITFLPNENAIAILELLKLLEKREKFAKIKNMGIENNSDFSVKVLNSNCCVVESNISDQLETLRKKFKKESKNHLQSENDNKNLKSQISHYEMELRQHQEHEKQLNFEKNQFSQQLEVLKENTKREQLNQKKHHEMKLSNCHEKIKQIHSLNVQLESEFVYKKQEIENLEQNNLNYKQEISQQNTEIQDLTEKLKNCKQSLDDAQNLRKQDQIEIELLHKKIDQENYLKEKIVIAKSESDLELKNRVEEIAHMTSKIDRMREMNQELKFLNMEYSNQLNILTEEKKCMRLTQKDLTKTNQNIIDEIERIQFSSVEMQTQNESLLNQLSQIKQSKDSNSQQFNEIFFQKSELELKYKKQITENENLKTQIETLIEEKLHFSNKLNEIKSENSKLTQQNEIITQGLSEKQTEYSECLRERDHFLSRNKQLENTICESQQLINQLETREKFIRNEYQSECLQKFSIQKSLDHAKACLKKESKSVMKVIENLKQQTESKSAKFAACIEKERSIYEIKINGLEMKVNSLNDDWMKKKADLIQSYENTIKKLEIDFNIEKKSLKDSIESTRKSTDDWRLKMEEEKQRILSKHEKQLSELQDKLVDVQLQNQNMQLKEHQFQIELGSLKELKITIERDLKQQCSILNSQLESQREQHNQAVQLFEREKHDFLVNKESLENEISNLNCSLEREKTNIQALTVKVDHSNLQNKQTKEALTIKTQILSTFEQNLVNAEQKLKSLESTNEKLSARLKELEFEKIENITKCTEISQDLLNLRQEKEFNCSKLADMESKKISIKNSCKNLKKENCDIKMKFHDLEKELETLKIDRDHLLEKCKKLQDKFNEQAKQYLNTVVKLKEERSFGLSAQTEKEKLENENIKMKNALDNFEKEIFELKENMKTEKLTLQSKIDQQITLQCETENEIYKLKSDLDNLQKANSHLETLNKKETNEKIDLMARLNSIHASLRRLIGFNQLTHVKNKDHITANFTNITALSTRNFADSLEQTNNIHICKQTTEELCTLDPEAVRLALRKLVEHILELERQKDELSSRIKCLTLQRDETNLENEKRGQVIAHLNHKFNDSLSEKKSLDDQFLIGQKAITYQEETLRRIEQVRSNQALKIADLERDLQSACLEKNNLQANLDKLIQSENASKESLKKLKREIDEQHSKCVQFELANTALQGNMERLQMLFSLKQAACDKFSLKLKKMNTEIHENRTKLEIFQRETDQETYMKLLEKFENLNTVKDQIIEDSEETKSMLTLSDICEEDEQARFCNE